MSKRPAGLAIFRAGQHVASDGRSYTFSEADVQAIAAGYDPGLAEAPLVVGHPRLDAPAYGWARALRAEGGVLYAEPHQVEPQFAQLVNEGRLKKISASIYLPGTPGNPTPGKPYLRHIGFLGAQAPAVKGLPSAQFADDGAAPTFALPAGGIGAKVRDAFQRIRDALAARDGADAAEHAIPQSAVNDLADLDAADAEPDAPAIPNAAFAQAAITPEITMSENAAADFAARQTQIEQRETALAARERALAEREAQARRQDVVDFAAGLVREGRLLPRQQAPIVEVLLALPAGTTVEFSQADGQAAVKQPAATALREVLAALPPQVDFAEKSGGGMADDEAQAPSFAAPVGEKIDDGRMAIHAKAQAFQRKNPNTSYLDAVRAVGG